MRKYKVQWAYAVDIGTPIVHRDEAMARGEVAHLLGTWIRRGLQDYLKRIESSPLYKRYPELEEAIRYLAPALKRLVEEGLVWDAYELWEDFYLKFEYATGAPLYVMTGTVIVEGSIETGLSNRIPLLEPLDVSPLEKYQKGPSIMVERTNEMKMAMLDDLVEVIRNKADLKGVNITGDQFIAAVESTDRRLQGEYRYMDEESEAKYLSELREGILRKIFPKLSGASLGAFRRWLVQYADFGGTWHPARHTNEDMAKGETANYLRTLMHHLRVNVDSEARMGRNPEYVEEANAILQHVPYLLDNKMVWTAYLDYKAFEEKWDRHFSPFPLTMAIGSMRVVPEPEPES